MRTVQLSKTYNRGDQRVYALDGVSLTIDPGQIVAIMGQSGSGKSTLLNILGGIDRATSGQAFLNSREVTSCSETELARLRRDTVGIVFQFFNLMPTMTVLENVELPARLARRPRSEVTHRATQLLGDVGLAARLHHVPHQLSGGEMQRAAIARALMNDPEILLADEPTGNLDSKNAQQVMALLKDLARKFGKTLLLATHSRELSLLADRTITLKDGRVQNA